MQDLNDLYYFTAVIEHGGFAPAARALNLPKSSLSRRVARLEDRLGVRLIERSTRRFAVTEVGQAFLAHARSAVEEARAAEEAALQVGGEPRGRVRVGVPHALAAVALAELTPRFLARYPKVKLELVVTNRPIDLIGEGVDVAFRVRPALTSDQSLMVRILGRQRTVVVGRPDFRERLGEPKHPDDLRGAPTLSSIEQPGRQVWRFTHADGREAVLEHDPVLRAGEFSVLVQAAMAGIGVAFLPELVCTHALRSGALVNLLPEWSPAEGVFHMVFTSRRGQMPAVSAFIDFMAEHVPRATALVHDASYAPAAPRS